jgi:CMP-N-acetylneuraminic acid synthetase
MNVERPLLTIIPAREGSRRLPEKNKTVLGGMPLIQWTISAALRASCVDEICISTNDMEIVDIAKANNLSVPFIRPEYLSTNSASSYDVVMHCIEWYRKNRNSTFDYILLLQPTTPLRTAEDIDSAWKYMRAKNADNIVSVCETKHHPLWTNTLPSDNSLKDFITPEMTGKRSQDLPTHYRLNGAIYFCRTERLEMEKSLIYQHGSYAFIMDKDRSVDIDDETDLRIAEAFIESTKRKS